MRMIDADDSQQTKLNWETKRKQYQTQVRRVALNKDGAGAAAIYQITEEEETQKVKRHIQYHSDLIFTHWPNESQQKVIVYDE